MPQSRKRRTYSHRIVAKIEGVLTFLTGQARNDPPEYTLTSEQIDERRMRGHPGMEALKRKASREEDRCWAIDNARFQNHRIRKLNRKCKRLFGFMFRTWSPRYKKLVQQQQRETGT